MDKYDPGKALVEAILNNGSSYEDPATGELLPNNVLPSTTATSPGEISVDQVARVYFGPFTES